MDDTAASRLCAACGMCCNGMMFHSVVLQPDESTRELKTLGLQIKRRKKQSILPQPCQAFRGTCCSVYAHRPLRCRLFVCRQLEKFSLGEISEEVALEKIRTTRRLADSILDLLLKSGSTNRTRSLKTRYDTAVSLPVEDVPGAAATRQQLVDAFNEFEKILAEDFRVE